MSPSAAQWEGVDVDRSGRRRGDPDTTIVSETTEVTADLVQMEEPADVSVLLPQRARLVVYLLAAMSMAAWGIIEASYTLEPWVNAIWSAWITGALLLAGANVSKQRRP